VQFVLSFPADYREMKAYLAFSLSLALIDGVDPSLELTPLVHFTQKKGVE